MPTQLKRFWFPLCLLLAGASLFIWHELTGDLPFIHPEAADALNTARKLLEGKRLYIDWVDVSLPSIYLLRTLPWGLGKLLHLPPRLLDHLLVMALAIWGGWLFYRLFPLPDPSKSIKRGQTPFNKLPLAMAFQGFVWLGMGVAARAYGQREHLFTLLLIPWVAWRLSKDKADRPIWIYAGALAFLATLKPAFLLILVCAEGFALFERRLPWRYYLALTLGAVLPLVLLGLHSPDSVKALLSLVKALPPTTLYPLYNLVHGSLLGTLAGKLALAGAVLSVVSLGTAILNDWVPLRHALGAALLLFLLGAHVVEQGQFVEAHYVPLLALEVFWLGNLLVALFESERSHKILQGLGYAMACAALVQLDFQTREGWAQMRMPAFKELFREFGEGMILTCYWEELTYAFNSEVRLLGKWPVHFMVPEMVKLPTPDAVDLALKAHASELREAIQRERPPFIVFSPRKSGILARDSLHQLFIDQRLLDLSQDYDRLSGAAMRQYNGFWKTWPIYRRKDLALAHQLKK